MPATIRKQQKYMAGCANPKSRRTMRGKCPLKKVARKFRRMKKVRS